MEKNFKLDELGEIAQFILKEVGRKNNEMATVVTFSGDLGTGKTTITQEIAKILGITESVVSPTFVIMKIYKTKDLKYKNLIHIDAYRLNKSEELLHLGWEEMAKNKENLIIVEWPERTPECFGNNVYQINLSHKDENTRTIEFIK